MTEGTKRILSILLVLLLAWGALVTVDFFRLNGHEKTKQPLIYVSGADYAYDYAMYGGLGYSVCYTFDAHRSVIFKLWSFMCWAWKYTSGRVNR